MNELSQKLSGEPRRQGERVARSPAFEALARAGFVARAAVYGIIGVLAIKVATGPGGETTDQQGALRLVRQQSFGEALLIALAIGLGGYALWRLTRAALGHGPEDSDDNRDRAAALISGIAYAILCVVAIGILRGGSGGGNESKTTAGVLGWTGGPVLVAIFGAGMLGAGLYQAYKGLARKFLDDAKTDRMSEPVRQGTRRWASSATSPARWSSSSSAGSSSAPRSSTTPARPRDSMERSPSWLRPIRVRSCSGSSRRG